MEVLSLLRERYKRDAGGKDASRANLEVVELLFWLCWLPLVGFNNVFASIPGTISIMMYVILQQKGRCVQAVSPLT